MRTTIIRRVALVVLAFLLVPASVATINILRLRADRLDSEAENTSLVAPPRRLPSSQLPLAVVVTGNHGTEITDMLPIVEMLGASGAFEVRVVAPERRVSPFFNAGLDFAPDLAFAELDELAGVTPALIVVPYILQWQTRDAAVVDWLRAHADVPVLSICAGAEVVAAAGLFDGFAATANDANLDALSARHRAVRWQRDVRWVADRNRFSSGTLTAGVDATLATIAALASPDAAKRAVRATAYPHARFLSDPRAATPTLGFGTMLEAAFRWERRDVGIVIEDGVSEAAVAGLMEAYAATVSARTVALASSLRVVRSRYGVGLVPRATIATAADLDERIEIDPLATTYGYDLALAEIERTHGGPQARTAAELMNYPSSHVLFRAGLPVGATMALRAIVLGLVAACLVAWSLFVRPRARKRIEAVL